MPTYTIEVPIAKKYDFINAMSEFRYLKIKNRTKLLEKFKKDLKQALKEVELIEQGTIQTDSIEDFLKELSNGDKS